ncbi:universal stress protein [Paraliomyxa miuraensis]|uniref:universal stress protein n=1 Tax=Paraliomyxa miuraensis TaxID=376150 RepID=UPI002256EB7E|nr:universal stress protein [Paraliomyxa miuraensis]MCX4246601.1 universal stress protein [Paraliomyxa miuraensis]
MTWVVGMDLSDRGQGALGYARWLRGVMPSERARFVGVHVLEEAELRQLLRYHHLEEVETRAARAAERVVADAGAEGALAERRVICGRSAEDALEQLAGQPGVRGLIIGRQARRGERRVVRLGRVARRLLRALPAPVVVVPPDLKPEQVGDGPVLLAAGTDENAAGAAEFAKELAVDLGRPLAVAHVVPGDDYLAAEMVPSGLAGEFFRQLRGDHERNLIAWMHAHGLDGVPRHVSEGSVVDRLAEVARNERAPLVVCGSRGLGLGMRLFSSSVATDLAAACEVPVAVVPNPG